MSAAEFYYDDQCEIFLLKNNNLHVMIPLLTLSNFSGK